MERGSNSDSTRAIGFPVAAMLIAVLLWGPSFVATKVALRELPPFTIAFLRFLVASCLLYPIWRRSNERISLKTNARRQLLLSGLLGITAYFILENLGIQFTTASDAALLMAAIPVVCLLVESLWRKQAVSWMRIAGIASSIVGMFLIVRQAPAHGGMGRLIGDLLIIAAALCWAAYSLLGKSLEALPRLTVVTHQTLYGTLMLLPFALFELPRMNFPSLLGCLSVLYLGVMCSTVTYLLYNYSLRAMRASQVSVFLNLVPVIGVITAVIFLGDQVHPIQIIGGIVIISGVFLSTLS